MTQEDASAKVRVDLACGQRPQPGFLGVDIWEGAAVVCDLEQYPWPFADDSVDEIYCSHYIEHVPDLVSFANELYRIMKVGAEATIVAPYYASIRAWQDPTHLRAISQNTFLYFNKEWRLKSKLDHYPIKADFDFRFLFELNPDWQGKPEEELAFAVKHYINVVDDIIVKLTKRASPVDLARERWQDGRYEEAAALCREAVEEGAATGEVYLMLGDVALQRKEYDEALESFKRSLAGDGDPLQCHAGVLRALQGAGRQQDAVSYLASVREEDEGLAELLNALVLESSL